MVLKVIAKKKLTQKINGADIDAEKIIFEVFPGLRILGTR